MKYLAVKECIICGKKADVLVIEEGKTLPLGFTGKPIYRWFCSEHAEHFQKANANS